MCITIDNIALFRIIPIANLEDNLQNGLYCKSGCPDNKDFKTIANKEIIEQRSISSVKCYPGTFVNDYVPFYFSIRTPMLYDIYTGRSVISYPQEKIIYLCFKMADLATDDFQWCYTDGNAANAITKFYADLNGIETNVDWHSIKTDDFRNSNADGDNDRVRKKHAEFLVKTYVPAQLIKAIVVFNDEMKKEVQTILANSDENISILVSPINKYYFQ